MDGSWDSAPGEKQSWDHDGAHFAAASRIIRALYRGTGCTLTREMVRALDFAEADGDWWTALREKLRPKGHSDAQ